MRNANHVISRCIAIIVLAITSPNVSNAETDIAKAVTDKAEKVIAKIQASCATDIKSFCSQVTPGEGRLMLCMMAHEDKLSDQCFKTSRRRWRCCGADHQQCQARRVSLRSGDQ